jgi:hypothetical protein
MMKALHTGCRRQGRGGMGENPYKMNDINLMLVPGVRRNNEAFGEEPKKLTCRGLSAILWPSF